MGFFKNIGRFVKRNVKSVGKTIKKNVSFKNLVKLGSMVDPTGLVGGLQQAHYAKKEAQQIADEQAREQALYDAEMQAQNAGANAVDYLKNKGLFGSAVTGAVGSAGSTVIDSSVNTWLKKNWLKLVAGIVGVGTLVFLAVRLGRGRQTSGSKRYYK